MILIVFQATALSAEVEQAGRVINCRVFSIPPPCSRSPRSRPAVRSTRYVWPAERSPCRGHPARLVRALAAHSELPPWPHQCARFQASKGLCRRILNTRGHHPRTHRPTAFPICAAISFMAASRAAVRLFLAPLGLPRARPVLVPIFQYPPIKYSAA
jgi:hypothetical protein